LTYLIHDSEIIGTALKWVPSPLPFSRNSSSEAKP